MNKHYSQLSEKEARRREDLGTRIDNLRMCLLNLQAAEEACQVEGFLPHGTLPEMIGQVNLIIRGLEDDFIEEG